MTQDEAEALWCEIDNYGYGYVSASSVQRWLAEAADFNMPSEDCHFIFDAFDVNEAMGRITEQQFFSVLCGDGAESAGENKEEPK